MTKTHVTLDEIETRTTEALTRHGASPKVARSVAKAVRVAEATGNLICGLYYLESYCQQLTTERVNGTVEPVVTRPKAATVQVNAGFGFAQPAFDAGLPDALSAASDLGIAALSIHHSHTCTSMGFYMLIDPAAYGVDLCARLNTLADAVESQPGARLPGRGKTLPSSVDIDGTLWTSVLKMAGATE